jgi:hypothetical protein
MSYRFSVSSQPDSPVAIYHPLTAPAAHAARPWMPLRHPLKYRLLMCNFLRILHRNRLFDGADAAHRSIELRLQRTPPLNRKYLRKLDTKRTE